MIYCNIAKYIFLKSGNCDQLPLMDSHILGCPQSDEASGNS